MEMTPAAAAGIVLIWMGTLSRHKDSSRTAIACELVGWLLWGAWFFLGDE